MQWFNGTITEAILTSRQTKSMFVVVVTSDDDESRQLLEKLEQEELSTLFKKFVCISLKQGTSEADQFNQFYPIVVLPSIYFIGLQGSPIEIIGGNVDSEALHAKSIQAFKTHLKLTSTEATTEGSNAATSSQTQSESKPHSEDPGSNRAEIAKAKESGQSDLGAKDKPTAVLRERKKDDVRQKEQTQQDVRRTEPEDRMKRLKDQPQKPENNDGNDSNQKSKSKEKEASQQRPIPKQIPQEKTDPGVTKKADKQKSAQPLAAVSEKPSVNRSELTRLQFRLPDGSTRTEQFSSSVKLCKIVEFIDDQIKPPFKHYSICATFPRREFDKSNMEQTLLELDLSPSAALLIVPKSSDNLHTESSLSKKIFSPFFWLWNLVWSMLSFFTFQLTPPPNPTTDATQPTNHQQDANQRTHLQRPNIRIRRLADASPDDSGDDNATWNGNSTQQL